MRILLIFLFYSLISINSFASTTNPNEKHDHTSHTGINEKSDEITDSSDPHEDHQEHEDHEDHDLHEEQKGYKEDINAHKSDSEYVVLTEKQKKLVNLKTSTVSNIDETKKISLYGEVHFDKTKLTKVMVKIPGFVKTIYKNIGEIVKKNTRLALIESHELAELIRNYFLFKAGYENSKAEFNRTKKLYTKERQVITEKDHLSAKQDYQVSKAELLAVKSKLKILGINPEKYQEDTENIAEYTVVSPINGTIIKKDITLGETFVEEDYRPIFVIADLRTVWVDFQAYHEDISLLKKGQLVHINFNNHIPDEEAEITYIAPYVDEETKTILVRTVLNNPKGEIRPGCYVTGSIEIITGKNITAIKKEAVIRIDGKTSVFVPEGKEYTVKNIKLGGPIGGYFSVLSGLNPGEKYVSHGSFELKAVLGAKDLGGHAGHGH